MEIREFVFRAMHEDPDQGIERRESLALSKSIIKNDPECRDLCGRFLYTEIFLGGADPENSVYDQNYWEPRAEYFINNIVPSENFMHDAIEFFSRIREGRC